MPWAIGDLELQCDSVVDNYITDVEHVELKSQEGFIVEDSKLLKALFLDERFNWIISGLYFRSPSGCTKGGCLHSHLLNMLCS